MVAARRQVAAHLRAAQQRVELPGQVRVGDDVLEQVPVHARQPAVEGIAWIARRERAGMVGNADLRPIALDAVDQLVAADVRYGGVAQHRHGVAPRLVARRPGAEHVGLRGIDVRFVDGHPFVDEVVERPHRRLRVPQIRRRRILRGEAAARREPAGIDEVVQRHQRPDALVAQIGDLLAVAVQHGMVELPRARFDARPLHAEARDRQPQRRHQVVVLAPPVPVVGGAQRRRPVGDVAGHAGPIQPVVVLVAALDLGGRRRRADEQAVEVDVAKQRFRSRRGSRHGLQRAGACGVRS